MLTQLFLNNIAFTLVFWIILYVSDYALTLLSAQLYYSGVSEKIVHERGIELNPLFEHDIALRRRVSWRFLVLLLASSFLIWYLWLITVNLPSAPEAFEVCIGALVLSEFAVHIRHLQNIVFFSYARHERGISGSIAYPRWLSLRASAAQLLGFAALYLFCAALTSRLFFVGGAVGCFALALSHWRRSRLPRSMAEMAVRHDG